MVYYSNKKPLHMKIDISTKNITLDDSLEEFIEDKIGGLDKYIGSGPVSARVEISKPSKHHKTGPVFYAEANLKVGGRLLRAEASHSDIRSAIVQVKDELKTEIKKFKDKQLASRRK